MKDWLKSGGAIPSDQEMYDDLIGPETIPTMDGIIQLEAKKDMKARGIPSPNKGDCLAQTFAFNIQKKNKNPFSKGNLKFAVHEIDIWG